MKGLERKALIFAKRAHEAVGQIRKYSGDSYIVHPIAVAGIVKSVRHTPEMVAAALLHDTVEDTEISLLDIQAAFGSYVYELVYWLTDVSTPADGNREARKAIDRAHIAKAPPAAKTIKLADLIDNTSTIKARDPDFWVTYRREKLLLLGEALREGDQSLWKRAMALCD